MSPILTIMQHFLKAYHYKQQQEQQSLILLCEVGYMDHSAKLKTKAVTDQKLIQET